MTWGYGEDLDRSEWSTFEEDTFDERFEKSIAESGVRPTPIAYDGDSWFALNSGIIAALSRDRRWILVGRADPGDTFEDMIFGTEYDRRTFDREPCPFDAVLGMMRRRKVAAFLFSGGGNDIVGPELEMLLNHKTASELDAVREDAVAEFLSSLEKYFDHMLARVWDTIPDLPIISHGYGRPVPDGTGYEIGGFGPWLRPAFVRKGMTELSESTEIIRGILDGFNEVLGRLGARHENFHYLDLRDEISDSDWSDEIHPDAKTFTRLARIFNRKMRDVVSA